MSEISITKGKRAGTTYHRDPKRNLIPSNDQYKMTIKQLSESSQYTTMMAIRLGCELGMSRIEIVNAEVNNIGRNHTRGLWVDVAKKVRRGNKFVMRSREIPININLYNLLKMGYIDEDNKYIIKREREKSGMIPLTPLHINFLYQRAGVPWSTHKSRHYFKNRLMDWMRANRVVDVGLIKELMGHKKTIDENYGSISWDYKLDVIDKVFV